MAHSAARMTTAATALAIAAALAAALAGCGGGSSKAPTAATFPNPVDIIKKAACSPEPGVTQGTAGLDGTFMFADCTYPSATSIRVATFTNNTDRDAYLQVYTPEDGQTIIVGDLFMVDLHAPAGEPAGYDPAPSVVLQDVGGKIR